MTATTLNASMSRLEGIKDKKHLYNKIKIAEAEALATEALRMANEAKLAAARLAEVKRTLSRFSRKLERAEQSVQKDAIKLKTIPVVVKKVPVKKEDRAVVKAPVEEPAKEEPVEKLAVVESPVEDTCKEEPVKGITIVESPVEDIAVVESPVEVTFKEEPAEEIAVVESPVEETFKEEPAEEIAVVESPVEEPAVVEAPVKESAKEETVEEPAVVEAPVEESVKVETVEEPAVLEAPVDSEPVEEVFKTDPPTLPSGFVSRNLINKSVIKVVEFKVPSVQEHVTTRAVTAPVAQEEQYKADIIEDFLDSLGVDKMCGVDDSALGFTDRPVRPSAPAPEPEAPFENPTRIDYKRPLNKEDLFLHSTSWKEELANHQRQEQQLPPTNYQRAHVNTDFSDPFGVDHDDLVLCGKIADLCEPPEFNEADYNLPDHFQEYGNYQ